MQIYLTAFAITIGVIAIIIAIYKSDKLRKMIKILDFYMKSHKKDIIDFIGKNTKADLDKTILVLSNEEFQYLKQYIIALIQNDHGKYSRDEIVECVVKNVLGNETDGFYWICDRLEKLYSKKIVLDKKDN